MQKKIVIEMGKVGEVERYDKTINDKWETVGCNIEDFVEFLNDCDDDNPLNLYNVWFRVREVRKGISYAR